MHNSFILQQYVLNPLLLPTDAHNVKNAELLKHAKLNKNAPTCFGLRRNHLQGAKVSAWLKITQYAAIALTTPCISFTQILLTKRVIFSQALTLAP